MIYCLTCNNLTYIELRVSDKCLLTENIKTFKVIKMFFFLIQETPQ